MTRGKRTAIVLGVATTAALMASYGVYAAISRIPERRVEIATKHAVVAATGMPVGTLLTEDSVKLVDWPERTPLAGGFSDIESVVNRGLIAPIVDRSHEMLPDERDGLFRETFT